MTRRGPRGWRRWRPSAVTAGLGIAAVVASAWAHLDARRELRPAATLVSTRSAAWRILPELARSSPTGATIELWPPHGEPVRLRPGGDAGGHRVWAGDQVLGPADPEAMEGLWDSLRMATTVRAADVDSAPGLGDGGRLVVALPGDAGIRTVVLGRPTADQAGRFGAIEGGAEGTEGLWVLEQELSLLVQQAPEAWLARRAVVLEPAEVLAVREGSLAVERGLDGRWRGRWGDQPAVMLDDAAVRTRLERLVSARLDPLVPSRPDDPGTPWLTLTGGTGEDWTLRVHGTCPGRPDRVLIDRGPGRWGCIDAALVEPWPIPGRDVPRPEALLEPRLAPHAYGRVLRIEQRRPQPRALQRYGGGWRIEESLEGRRVLLDVDEAEALRWYRQLHDAEVALETDDLTWPAVPDVELVVSTDSTATLQLRCREGPPLRCRRDDGPVLRVRGRPVRLSFDADTFAERRLTAVRVEDIRAVEILPGAAGSSVLRQSAHLDFGVWRLDAPAHPEGDAVLDSERLESLLGALGALRAEAWVDPAPDEAAVRRLRIERIPRRGQEPSLEIELLPGCVVRVPGHRPARLGEGTCETVGRDLLSPWPMQRSLDLARRLELRRGGAEVRLVPRAEVWAREDGGPAPEASAWLSTMHERTAAAVVRGAPGDAPGWRLRVLPAEGTPYAFEGTSRWIRVEGAGWYYALEPDLDP